MKRFRLGCGTLVLAIGTLLSGCGGPQLQTGVPATQSPAMRAERGASWMLPQAKGAKSTLIYAADEESGGVRVYDYSSGQQVGDLTGVLAGAGCVDARGNVYFVEGSGTVLKYAHGGTAAVKTYSPGGAPVGCSVDAKGDLAVTGSTPGFVTVYARGNPRSAETYSNAECETQASLGYDNKGNIVGVGGYSTSVYFCAVLARSDYETTLLASGISVRDPNGTMWDGQYIAISDDGASGGTVTGINEASLSGTTLTSHGEVLLEDTCYRGYVDVRNPFILGKKNTPVNDTQGTVVVGSNLYCFSSGNGGGIEFWHYPQGGDPFKTYGTGNDVVTVLAVSIGT